MRIIPSHAVELTAAYLDRSVADILARHPRRFATLGREQEVAALIHLCGAGAGDEYMRHGMRLAPGERCGTTRPGSMRRRTGPPGFQALEAEQR